MISYASDCSLGYGQQREFEMLPVLRQDHGSVLQSSALSGILQNFRYRTLAYLGTSASKEKDKG